MNPLLTHPIVDLIEKQMAAKLLEEGETGVSNDTATSQTGDLSGGGLVRQTSRAALVRYLYPVTHLFSAAPTFSPRELVLFALPSHSIQRPLPRKRESIVCLVPPLWN